MLWKGLRDLLAAVCMGDPKLWALRSDQHRGGQLQEELEAGLCVDALQHLGKRLLLIFEVLQSLGHLGLM